MGTLKPNVRMLLATASTALSLLRGFLVPRLEFVDGYRSDFHETAFKSGESCHVDVRMAVPSKAPILNRVQEEPLCVRMAILHLHGGGFKLSFWPLRASTTAVLGN